MNEWLLRKCGAHYILAMMLLTRMFCIVGGGLVVYYINLTLSLPAHTQRSFEVAAVILIHVSSALTVLLAFRQTHTLRAVLRRLDRGEVVSIPEGRQAGREAVLFSSRQHLHEAWVVPASTVLPLCLLLWRDEGATREALVQVCIAGFIGISAVLLLNFFASERWMATVVRHLLGCGVPIRFGALPSGRIQRRMNVCFSLTIAVTVLMVGGLANQRALDIIRNPGQQDEAVANLRRHTGYILLTALGVGFLWSRMLSNSVASRASHLVDAMKQVKRGELSKRLQPTGTDEIDALAREFNTMVEQLDQNDRTIRDLNGNLERKVKRRTRQLSKNKHSLQRSLRKLGQLYRELDQRNGDLESTLSKLRSAQAQLVHSEKMNSLGQLIAGLAHEINNSINAVYNGIQPLHAKARRLEGLVSTALEAQNGRGDTDARREIDAAFRRISMLADVVEHGASRTARIVGDLKSFSHPGSETCESFDLHQALNVCLSLLSGQFKHRITVQKDYGEIGLIHAPSGQLNQVFMNILANAQQAIPGEGTISISTRREGGGVRIGIRDTGAGIPDEIKARIFDPFFTTKEPGVGTGLGLSLSYSIVTQLGGTLECHSQVGAGTEFVVSLPCEASEPSSEASALNAGASPEVAV